MYHRLFDEAVKKYNEKQKRADRRITDYYEKICSGKQEKPFMEIIVQIGNKDDTACGTPDSELAERILGEYYESFAERNPHLCVFSAHLHLDEATPHLHIDFVPYTTGSTRGLETRVSLKQALAEQGFTGTGRGDTEWSRWALSEKQALSEIMERHGTAWKQKGMHNEHLSVLDYKKQERTKEVQALEKVLTERKAELDTLVTRVRNMEETDVEIDKIQKLVDDDSLPEPSALMTAKSYRSKIAVPLFERLKKLIKTLVSKYKQLADRYLRLNSRNGELSRENDILRQDNKELATENDKLRKENKDYAFLSKTFGKPKMDELMKEAKEARETQSRNKRSKEIKK